MYGYLSSLAASLKSGGRLKVLLPDWHGDRIALVLDDGAGRPRPVALRIPGEQPRRYVRPASRVALPSTERADQAFSFLDAGKKTAILRVVSMAGYREAFEMWRAMGQSDPGIAAYASQVYRRFHGSEPPADEGELVAGLPSATDLFRDLVEQMGRARTETLLVDVRDNGGGNSFMAAILVYFLYGAERVRDAGPGYAIARYSDLFFRTQTNNSLELVNRGRDVPLVVGDYDFSEEAAYRAARGRPRMADAKDFAGEMERLAFAPPTFVAEARTLVFSGHYRPKRVVVLTAPGTYSAAFDLAVALYQMGAELVGTPPAQAGNCFIDTLPFTLPNSGLAGSVAYKRMVTFPEDEAMGKVLKPHRALTYQRLAQWGFDPNAEVLLALERP